MIRYKRISETAIPFQMAHESDAAFDIFSDEESDIFPKTNKLISSGVALEMEGYYALVLSRSGLAAKSRVFVLNAPGLIDPGYRGEIKVILQNLGDRVYTVQRGERIAQILFLPYSVPSLVEVKELSKSDRGNKGFGSSGKK